jgi:hypothetical protein
MVQSNQVIQDSQVSEELLADYNEIAQSILQQISNGVIREEFPDRTYTYAYLTEPDGNSITIDRLINRGLQVIRREIIISHIEEQITGVPRYMVMYLFYRDNQFVSCINLFSFAEDYINDTVAVNDRYANFVENSNISSDSIYNINQLQQPIIDFVISQDTN